MALHDQHVFVVIVGMGDGGGGFAAGPECHLAAVGAIEDVPSTPGVAWLPVAILLAGCFINSGKSFIGATSFRQ
jgi:hypothetical protein